MKQGNVSIREVQGMAVAAWLQVNGPSTRKEIAVGVGISEDSVARSMRWFRIEAAPSLGQTITYDKVARVYQLSSEIGSFGGSEKRVGIAGFASKLGTENNSRGMTELTTIVSVHERSRIENGEQHFVTVQLQDVGRRIRSSLESKVTLFRSIGDVAEADRINAFLSTVTI